MPDQPVRLQEKLFAAVQRNLPTRLLSWCMYKLTRLETRWFKNAFIRVFMRLFRISLEEAALSKPELFPHFNAFFTRALRREARPLDPNPDVMISPVDGTVSQLGRLQGASVLQAKGHAYSAAELLGGDPERCAPFHDGHFCTIYLAPNNYHRIHMPLAGALREWVYVPGRLFSVNKGTVKTMPNLFAGNERVVSIFDTSHGPLALVMVGALFVGSMETVWAGLITPPHERPRTGSGVASYQPMRPVVLERGAEMGRFNMGSTVILLTAPGAVQWLENLTPGAEVRMGRAIAGMSA